jgi:pimeloyl-ACP methyl ester carboxylesterase
LRIYQLHCNIEVTMSYNIFNFRSICQRVGFGILVVMCVLSSSLSAQSYSVGHTSITFKDPARSNRNIPCEIYYPSTSTGDNTPISKDRKFPCISFGHGFLMTWDAYKNVWNTLVPNGFIMVFPKTEGTASPSHSEFGNDLAYVLSAMESESNNASSIFYNQVDSMNCVMGHSMGGGAAFLAASKSTKIKFIATLAAAETNPSAIKAATKLSIPSLVIAGGNDCVTPPKDHQIPMYDSLKSTCKHLVTITGGSHCQMAEDNFLCNFGEATCSPKASISRSEQHQIQFQFLIPWLKFHLLSDITESKSFDSLVSQKTGVQIQKNCQLAPNTSNIGIFAKPQWEIFPNPADNYIRIKIKNLQEIIRFELINLNGKQLFNWNYSVGNVSEFTLWIPDSISSGLYLLQLCAEDKIEYKRVIIQ